MITVTTYDAVPAPVQGLVRDMRVRWALEEAGLDYETQFVGFMDRLGPDHMARHPFGQVPVYEEDGLRLFESGAILLHIADKSETLMPADAAGRAEAVQWLMAALNTIEGPAIQLVSADIFNAGKEWAQTGREDFAAAAQARLGQLAGHLEGRDWLGGRFTVADLTMATVLRFLRHTDLVTADPVLGPYLERCEARPAFQKALADHMAVYTA